MGELSILRVVIAVICSADAARQWCCSTRIFAIPSCPLTTTISVCSHALWLPSEVLSLCILLILWMDHAQPFSLKPLWCLYPHHSLPCHHFHCTYDHQLWVSSMITNSGGSFLPQLYLPWKGFIALWPSSPSWQSSNGGIPLSPALGVPSLVL